MLLGKCSSSCLHSGVGICGILAETNSVTCLLHSYQHDAPNLTLIFCTMAHLNMPLYSLMLDCHSLFKTA